VLLLKSKAEMIPDKPDTDNTGVGMHGQDCLSAALLPFNIKALFQLRSP